MNEYKKNNCCSYIYQYIVSFYNNIKNNNIKNKIEPRIVLLEKHRCTKATFIEKSNNFLENKPKIESYQTETDMLNLNNIKYSLNEPTQIIKETIIEKIPLINKHIIIDIDDDFELINYEK